MTCSFEIAIVGSNHTKIWNEDNLLYDTSFEKLLQFGLSILFFFVLVPLDLEILKKQQLFLSVESNSIKFSTLNEFSKRHYMPLLELWHSDFLIFRYRNYFSTKINFQILICIHPINEICNSWWSCLNKCDCLCTHSLNY